MAKQGRVFGADGVVAPVSLNPSQFWEVEISRHHLGGSGPGAWVPMFEVQLTDKGTSLVSAWRAGDPDAIADTLSREVHDGVKVKASAQGEISKKNRGT